MPQEPLPADLSGSGPGGDNGDNSNLGPEDQAAARAAAAAKRAAAEAVEPEVSADVRAIVEAYGGTLERFDSRFKDASSLNRKIQALVALSGDAPDEAAASIRDSLRYTAVIADDGYWAKGTQIGEAFEAVGYTRTKQSQGWLREGYRGRNDFFKTESGHEFEVQFHTEQSLAATEETHDIYNKQRLLPVGSDEWLVLEHLQNDRFELVQAPPDVKWAPYDLH